MENENKNTMVVAGANAITTNLFADETSKKMMTTLDVSDENQADMLLNALQDVDFKLNECIGQEIECVGCYITETEVDSFNDETGEQITRKKHVLMLFDKDGKSYVTGSNSCYMSFKLIAGLKGLPSQEKPLLLKPIKVDAEVKGHSYLKLQLVKKSS